MLCDCSDSNIILKVMSVCTKCFHPCHCREEEYLHADEYGICTCEKCECKNSSDDKTYENEVNEK